MGEIFAFYHRQGIDYLTYNHLLETGKKKNNQTENYKKKIQVALNQMKGSSISLIRKIKITLIPFLSHQRWQKFKNLINKLGYKPAGTLIHCWW